MFWRRSREGSQCPIKFHEVGRGGRLPKSAEFQEVGGRVLWLCLSSGREVSVRGWGGMLRLEASWGEEWSWFPEGCFGYTSSC